MGTPIWEPPSDIPKDPDTPPPVLTQLLLDPTFSVDQTNPGGDWFLYANTFWAEGQIYTWLTGPGQGGAQQGLIGINPGDELTAIIGISALVSDLTPGFGADIRLGTFDTGDITFPGVYGYNFIAAGNLERIILHSPGWNGSPVGFAVDFCYLYNQRLEDAFWTLGGFGLNFPTFWERWDYENNEYVLRFANKRDATNILFKFEP